MNPRDALNILNQAAAAAPMNRQEHIVAQQALDVLASALERLEMLEDAAAEDKEKDEPGD